MYVFSYLCCIDTHPRFFLFCPPRIRICQPRFHWQTIHMPRTSLTQQLLDSTKDPEITCPFKPRDHSSTTSDFYLSRFIPDSCRSSRLQERAYFVWFVTEAYQPILSDVFVLYPLA